MLKLRQHPHSAPVASLALVATERTAIADQPKLLDVEPDHAAVLKRRTWARHQHARIVDPADDERYTLWATVKECMRLARVDRVDIDVAACPEAHVADIWYGQQADGSFIDGLSTPWRPADWEYDWAIAWCNPPYSDIASWVERAWLACYRNEVRAALVLLPGDRCEQPWWQQWVEPFRDERKLLMGTRLTTHHLAGRQKFGSPDDPHGLSSSQAPFPSVLLVFE